MCDMYDERGEAFVANIGPTETRPRTCPETGIHPRNPSMVFAEDNEGLVTYYFLDEREI